MEQKSEPKAQTYASAAQVKLLLMIAPAIIAAGEKKVRINPQYLAQTHGVKVEQVETIIKSLVKDKYITFNRGWTEFTDGFNLDMTIGIDRETSAERGFNPYPSLVLEVDMVVSLRQLLAQLSSLAQSEPSTPTPQTSVSAPLTPTQTEQEIPEELLEAARALIHQMLPGFHRQPPANDLELALKMLGENVAKLAHARRIFEAAFHLFGQVEDQNRERRQKLERARDAVKEAATEIEL